MADHVSSTIAVHNTNKEEFVAAFPEAEFDRRRFAERLRFFWR